MRIRKKKWATPELLASPIFIRDGSPLRGSWRGRFKNPLSPLHLELGCGKGGFISAMAAANPKINFIAMDLIDDMLAQANRKLSAAFKDSGGEIGNVLLLSHNISYISDVFAKEDRVSRIYINFCNPWPKPSHKKRRLTHTRQLLQYRELLDDDGEIIFKTDDYGLFGESLAYFEEAGFEVLQKSLDLHQSGIEGSVMTEHEEMFSKAGIKIKYLRAGMLKSAAADCAPPPLKSDD